MTKKKRVDVDRPDCVIGLIAGGGQFPLLIARAAREEGFSVVAVGVEGETDRALAREVDNFYTIQMGQLGKLIECLKKHDIKRVALAGSIDKARIYHGIKLDWRGFCFALKLPSRNDDFLLRALAGELEKENIIVEPATLFLPSLLAPEGLLSKRGPTSSEMEDIAFGWKIAKSIGELDIGQCVVVKGRAVLAVEGIDGTDATILRGGSLCRQGAVVVKVSKPRQDLRFDMPAVGLGTIEVMKRVQGSVLALEAEKTIIFDKESMLEEADRASISVVGLKNETSLESLKHRKHGLFRNIFSASQALQPFSEKVRVGVVGVGYLGRFHAEKLAGIPSAELVGVADVLRDRGEKTAKKLGVEVFTSHKDLLDKVEAVSIVTPSKDHFEIARDFLEAGVHVFIEKPMTLNIDEADFLTNLAEKKGCILQVGHIERFNPAFRAVEAYVKEPFFIEAKRLTRFKPRVQDVDVVLDLMIHDLDIILCLVKADVKDYRATGASIVTDVADVAVVTIEFENGTVASLEANRVWKDDVRMMKILQREDTISVDYLKRQAFRCVMGINGNQVDMEEKVLRLEEMDPLEEELKAFVDSVRSGTKPLVNGESACKVLRWALHISKTLQNCRKY